MSSISERRQHLINQFEGKARMMADMIKVYNARHPRPRYQNTRSNSMDFSYIGDCYSVPLWKPPHFAQIWRGEGIIFWFNPHAFIFFFNIRPRAGADAKVEAQPAEVIDKRLIGANHAVLTNATSSPVTRRRVFTETVSETQNLEEEVSVSATAELRQLISYGGEATPVQGETEFKLSVTAGYRRSQSQSKTETAQDEGGFEIVVPPYTELSVDRTMSVGTYRQQIRTFAELDWAVAMWSHGDFEVNWWDRTQAENIMRGVGVAEAADQNWAGMMAEVRLEDLWTDAVPSASACISSMVAPIEAEILTTIEFDQASDTKYDWGEKKLPRPDDVAESA